MRPDGADPGRTDHTLAVLGAGRLGEALLSGLLRSGWATPDRIRCAVRRPEHARQLADDHGVQVGTEAAAAAGGADILVVAVKPQSMRTLLAGIAPVVTPDQTLISVAAGVSCATIESRLAAGVPVVRVMTNVPVEVDEAMSAIAPGSSAGDEHLLIAEEILSPVGKVLRVDEEHLDAVTALSGSGPAYLFLVAEAMIDAGVLLGLSRAAATDLVVQTMVGSAKMLRDAGRHPAMLREAVTSPGGTTGAAVRVLEEQKVRAAFLNAVEAARDRAAELAGG